MAPAWMKRVLLAAAVYNVVWGAVAILFPLAAFEWAGMPPPNYPELWQCIGMIVGVYGIGYAVAAYSPFVHWPVVFVGLLGKILGPIGFGWAIWRDRMPLAFGWNIVTNDLIWWVPFSMILWSAFRHSQAPPEARVLPDPMSFRTQNDVTLGELSQASPVLLVLLRHAGCTFCREALKDLAARRAEIERRGVRIAVAHMGAGDVGALLAEHRLGDIARIEDPEQLLYRALGLQRGGFAQLFGLRVWLRGIEATLHGNLVGRLAGDGFQMPGVFLIERGRVVASYRHATAADRPDYAAMASECAIPANAPGAARG